MLHSTRQLQLTKTVSSEPAIRIFVRIGSSSFLDQLLVCCVRHEAVGSNWAYLQQSKNSVIRRSESLSPHSLYSRIRKHRTYEKTRVRREGVFLFTTPKHLDSKRQRAHNNRGACVKDKATLRNALHSNCAILCYSCQLSCSSNTVDSMACARNQTPDLIIYLSMYIYI